MTKKIILTLIMAFSCVISQPMAAKSFEKTMSELANNAITAGAIAGGSYLAWMLWDTSSREQQVKTDRIFLRNIYLHLLRRPIQLSLEAPNFGRVNADGRFKLYWLHWRVDPTIPIRTNNIRQTPSNHWKTARELWDAGVDTVINTLLDDKRRAKIVFLGKGLRDDQVQRLQNTRDGLGLIYYDMLVELRTLQKILTSQLMDIFRFSKPELVRNSLIAHAKSAGRNTHEGLLSTLVYLRECDEDQINDIRQAYQERIPIDVNSSYWYKPELENCLRARNYFWDLLNRYVRLYTLAEFVLSRLGGNVARYEPARALFNNPINLPPYNFGRKNWSPLQQRRAANNNRNAVAIRR